MAQILAQALGGKSMEAFWYHFAILFEALFILTAVDAGTRVGRFMIQDMLGHVWAPLGNTEFLPANLLCTGLCVSLWGYFLYQGVVDPLGGINTLWPLFGIGNQMLAGIALLLCTVVLMKMKRERYVWVTLVPTAWLLVTTLTAGWQKIFHPTPAIGFIAQGRRFAEAAANGTLIAPAKSIAEMQRVAFNNYLDAAVCGFFVVLVAAMCVYALLISLKALRARAPDGERDAARGRRCVCLSRAAAWLAYSVACGRSASAGARRGTACSASPTTMPTSRTCARRIPARPRSGAASSSPGRSSAGTRERSALLLRIRAASAGRTCPSAGSR